ncbi:MAG: hypothetical protein CMF25_02965 [Kangiellaceae bacterium]|nr:hypothetical protein [Kangiellaceae bacterium]|tara:strand:+ start:2514 stop:4022 length:1509 start_codon:yes stop_codon:yes gene_type:complete
MQIKRLFVGSSLRFISLLANVAVAFYMMPFLIKSLGDHWYGIWVVIGTIVSYYGVLDVGLSSATQRFLAHALPRKDPDELNRILVSSLGLFSIISLVGLGVTLACFVGAPFFIDGESDTEVFQYVIVIMGGAFSLAFPFYVLNGVLTANLRYDYSSYIELGKLLVRTLGFVVVIEAGYGIIAMAAVTLVVNLLGYVVLFVLARRLAPWMKIRRHYFCRQQLKAFFSYGIYTFITFIADKLRFSVDNIVVGAFMGFSAVSHYNIASRLAEYFIMAIGSLLGVMTPVFTRLHSENKLDEMRHYFIQTSRVGVVLTSVIGGVAMVFALPFISLWMGPDYLDALWPFIVLISGLVLGGMQIPSVNLLYATATHRFYAAATSVEAVANLILSLIFIHYWGLLGVALGTMVPILITKVLVQPRYVCRVAGLPLATYYRKVFGLFTLCVAIQVPLAYVVLSQSIHSYWQLVSWAAGYIAVFVVVAYTLGLQREEKARVKTWLSAKVRRG